MSGCLACHAEHDDAALQCPRCRSGLRQDATDARTLPETAVPQRNAAQGVPDVFIAWCREQGVAEPTPEYRFDKKRKWRFDYAWPDKRVALEVEGGAYSQGRHVRGKGFKADCEKYNAATASGWRLLRVLPSQLCTLETLMLVRRTLALAA